MDTDSILRGFADNQSLFDAVKDIIKKQFTTEDITTNMTNENLGAITRARLDGLQRVEAGFEQIKNHRTIKIKSVGENPAR